jgi:glutathione S-transferase
VDKARCGDEFVPFDNFDNPYTDRHGRWLASRVAAARQTYADEHEDQNLFNSPQIYSNPIFMIAFRNQMNFLEYLLLFLPLLWLAAVSYGDYWAAPLGLSYVLGRFLYAWNYPIGHRGGVMLANLSMLILLFAVAAHAVFSLAGVIS